MKHITVKLYVELEVLQEVRDQCRDAMLNAMRLDRVTTDIRIKWYHARHKLQAFEFVLASHGRGHFDPPGTFKPHLPAILT
jgi:hypothetical protein